MSQTTATPLAEFHRYVETILQADRAALISPEEVVAQWRAEQATLEAIRDGLADVEAGRTVPLEEFDQSFRQRHGITSAR